MISLEFKGTNLPKPVYSNNIDLVPARLSFGIHTEFTMDIFPCLDQHVCCSLSPDNIALSLWVCFAHASNLFGFKIVKIARR